MLHIFFLLLLTLRALAQQTDDFPEIPLPKLSDSKFTALGQKALAVRASEWRHGESEHFVFHFFDRATASAVSVEAEFYYRVIAQELGRDTARWERKCHVFLFHDEGDWRQFQAAGTLDPWSGGIHAGGSLFLLRKPGWKARDHVLPHEISHLVFERFIGAGVPLWLNEGFAEYAASRCQAAFYRARGFNARPRAGTVPAEGYIPLAQLTAAAAYPADANAVPIFYDESQKLVRFLAAADKAAFLAMLDALAKGARFESALTQSFGARFRSLDMLEQEFKPYATSALRPN